MMEWGDVPIFQAAELSNKHNIAGPAVIESEFTTIVLGHNEILTKYSEEMLIIKLKNIESIEKKPTKLKATDPVTLSVVENRLESIAIEMMDVMIRTSMSQILNSSRDFSTAILDN